MPQSLYGILYNMDSLLDMITICKDVYTCSPAAMAKGLNVAATLEASGGTPFPAIKS